MLAIIEELGKVKIEDRLRNFYDFHHTMEELLDKIEKVQAPF